MTHPARRLAIASLALVTLALAGCSGTQFDPPDLHGAPLMASVDGKPVLLVLTKQEERRVTRTGGGRNRSPTERRDTLFHFDLRAYDPVTATPLWRARLVTFNDPERSTRIIGSSTSGALLGQEGERVWLQIAESPSAVSVRDGTLLVDAGALEAANPELAGKLPSEARFYAFDAGLVVHAADARRWVVRGASLKAEPWSPRAPATESPPLKANGMPKVIPLRPPLGEAPARLAKLDDRLIGLFSENEAADASNDPFGDRLAYSYSILDERALARRSFWTVQTAQAQRFDERFEQIRKLEPLEGSPVFLRGRFLKKLPGEEPLAAADPPGVLAWHSTRMDDAGQLALTRLDAALKPLWTAELPLSESGTANPVRYWLPGDHVVVLGEWSREIDHQVRRASHLVSVSLRDGSMVAHNLTAEPTSKHDPTEVPPRNGGGQR